MPRKWMPAVADVFETWRFNDKFVLILLLINYRFSDAAVVETPLVEFQAGEGCYQQDDKGCEHNADAYFGRLDWK